MSRLQRGLPKWPLEFASLRHSGGTVAELVDRMFDPSVTQDDFAWLRENWSGRLIVKGVQHPDDARALADLGADAIVVSNHGGRQLDRAVTPLEVLPEIVRAVEERTEVLLDTGVLDGADIVAAVANGATALHGWPCLPLRPDGRRRARRRPGAGDPVRPGNPDLAPSWRREPRRPDPRPRRDPADAGVTMARPRSSRHLPAP